MNDSKYAIVVKRDKQKDYVLPMSLEDIDRYFVQYQKEGVLRIMGENDSVLNETDVNRLMIKKIVNGILIEDKNTPIIEDSYYLSFPVASLPIDFVKKEKLANVIYNRLEPYLAKNVTPSLKEAILSLKRSKKEFLEQFEKLSYSEQRLIRVIIMKNFNVKKYLNPENGVEILE